MENQTCNRRPETRHESTTRTEYSPARACPGIVASACAFSARALHIAVSARMLPRRAASHASSRARRRRARGRRGVVPGSRRGPFCVSARGMLQRAGMCGARGSRYRAAAAAAAEMSGGRLPVCRASRRPRSGDHRQKDYMSRLPARAFGPSVKSNNQSTISISLKGKF